MIRIRISKDLRDELKGMKRPGETYNDLLLRLLDRAQALKDDSAAHDRLIGGEHEE